MQKSNLLFSPIIMQVPFHTMTREDRPIYYPLICLGKGTDDIKYEIMEGHRTSYIKYMWITEKG